MRTLADAEAFFLPGTNYVQRHGTNETGRNCTAEMNGLMELLRGLDRRVKELEAAELTKNHDVVCLFVKEALHAPSDGGPIKSLSEMVAAAGELAKAAHVFADAVYPPPAEPRKYL